MKRMLAWLLVLTLLLSGCAGKNKTYVEDDVTNTAPGAADEPLGGTPGRIDAEA